MFAKEDFEIQPGVKYKSAKIPTASKNELDNEVQPGIKLRDTLGLIN